jgi:predicted alpha-1,6-mannanase (GH76 family)
MEKFFLTLLLVLFGFHCCLCSEFQAASFSFRQFMNWYFPTKGVWSGHLSNPPDWCRGNGIEALSNFYLFNEDQLSTEEKDYIWQVLVDVQKHQGTDFYQTADYFDDILWWSLAYTRAYEVAMKRNELESANYFLTQSQMINDVVFNDSWTTDFCGGGVYWNRDFAYKNAITNELYLASAARLAYLTKEERFMTRAQQELEWFLNSGMIQQDYLIVDGLDNSCQFTGAEYTYNQGVILGGLVEMNRLFPNSSLITLGENILSSVLVSMTDTQGILTEAGCGDGALFKGILTRYIRYFLDLASPSELKQEESFEQFLVDQTLSVWKYDRDVKNGYFGQHWGGPAYDSSIFHNLQIASIDLFNSVRQQTSDGNDDDDDDDDSHEETCNNHGTWVMNTCACFARYSGKSCEVEVSWSEYYHGKTIALSALGDHLNELWCVTSAGTCGACLDDKLDFTSYLTVELVGEDPSFNQIRLKMTKENGENLYLTYDSTRKQIRGVKDANESMDSIFKVVILSSSISNPLSLERIQLQVNSENIGYVRVGKSSTAVTSDSLDATNFLVNLKQSCQ